MMIRRSVMLGTALFLAISPLAAAASNNAQAKAVPTAASVAFKQGSFTEASVVRQSNGNLVVKWKADANLGAVKVYWSSKPDGGWQLLASTYAMFNGIATKDPNPSSRIYFKIKGGNGATITTAERLLPLQGTTNFRDLGGYKTTDGKTVKWGKLFRADELAGLTDSDKSYLVKSGLKTNVDYRTTSEVAAKPDPTIAGVNYVYDPVFDESASSGGTDTTSLFAALASGDSDALGEPGDMLIQGNISMVDSPAAYEKLFDLLLDPTTSALVQHCTAGKDRTGLGSALILLALGVPKETVVNDFLLSNVYRAAYNKASVDALVSQLHLTDPKAIEVVQALMDVRPEYINAAFDEMDKQYGSVQGFLEKGIGVSQADQKKLKSLYLE